jgi:hopanoid C-3 methylase
MPAEGSNNDQGWPDFDGVMKILLINPPNCGKSIPEERYGIESIKMIFCGEPLALETLAGNLDGHDVVIADLKMEPQALTDGNLTFVPDLVGITGVTCEANTVLAIAEQMKARFNVPVAVGGHHASCDPDFFRRPFIDFIVVGLGKLSFRELVDALEAGRPVSIPGIHGHTAKGPDAFVPRQYTIEDLVDRKAPRYDLVARHRDRYVMSGAGGRVGFVATAAGCTHGCSFCSISSLTGDKYLRHSHPAVLRDIHLLGDVPVIRLVDANTFGHAKSSQALARKIMAADIRKRLVADVRADTVVRHPELLQLWHDAGLALVVIGFEEINDQKLAAFNKKSSHQTHLKAIEILKSIGIRIVGDFIISPEYGHEDFERLIDFVEKSGIDLPIPAVLTPLPGTPLYRRLKPQITIHDLDYYTFTNAVIPTRMAEADFYRSYADMLKLFLGRVH